MQTPGDRSSHVAAPLPEAIPLIECVPNFSVGPESSLPLAIERAIRQTGAAFLDRISDRDHNRTVVTFAGSPGVVAEAAIACVRLAVDAVDLREHTGVHPRIGAADVLPFVPLRGMALSDCADFATSVGERIWRELGVAVYLYEFSARTEERRRLENIRLGKITGGPDFGDFHHPSAGAVITGARRLLVAWNVLLESDNLAIAKRVAKHVRESGGGFPGVKALGLPLASQGRVQVSINTTNFLSVPLHLVFEEVVEACRLVGVAVTGSELIGLIPRRALELSVSHDLRWLNLSPSKVLENQLRDTLAIDHICLSGLDTAPALK